MNLVDEEITHKVFGEGHIVEQDSKMITIDFNDELKKFVYPDVFGQFITLNDEDTAKSFQKILSKQEMKEEELRIKREKEQAQLALERQRREMLKNHKIHESSQIVFWLDEEEQQNVFTEWELFTGEIQSGKNKGQPNRAARLRPNSASLLTVRTEDQDEKERRILGLYMVDETFSGNMSEDGMVTSHEDFRIELTEEESEKMLFWNYYLNKNHPNRTTWNVGKYRYFDNIWTAQILQDLIALRTDEEKIQEAQEFLEYFCHLNALDTDNIPVAAGALKQ